MRLVRFILVTLALIVGPAAVLGGSLVPLGSNTTPPPATAVFLGDSYTAGAAASSAATTFPAVISAAEGWTEVNLGIGGAGYILSIADDRARPYCGRDYCPSYTEMIPAAAAARPDVVVVNGGRNESDRADEAWAAGVRAFYVSLRAALPHARIIATSPIWDDDPVPAGLPGMRTVVQRAVTAVGGTYVDLGDPLLGRLDLLAVDSIHPNDAGHAAIASAFAAAYTRTG